MTRTIFYPLILLLASPLSSVAGQYANTSHTTLSNTGYQAQFQQTADLNTAPILRMSHSEDGQLWETTFSTKATVTVVSTVVTETRLLVLGNFNDDLWINDLFLAAGHTPSGFLAVFDRDSGNLDKLIRIGGSQATQALGLIADNQGWLVIGRHAGKIFHRTLDLEYLIHLNPADDNTLATFEGFNTNTTPFTMPKPGTYHNSASDDGGVLTNPGDTGQDPPPPPNTGSDPNTGNTGSGVSTGTTSTTGTGVSTGTTGTTGTSSTPVTGQLRAGN